MPTTGRNIQGKSLANASANLHEKINQQISSDAIAVNTTNNMDCVLESSDFAESETVYVTTEDDSSGQTITFVQNLHEGDISGRKTMTETEYIVQENPENIASHLEAGKIS